MWQILLDALIDSAIALPFLLAIYLFIEFLERNKRAKQRTVRLLNGRLAPLVAGGVGLVPQCGFSVMATDLYCQNYLKLGTLIAFFVATSDEALPILLTNSKTVSTVWVVLLVKIVYAVLLGYLINLVDRRLLSTQYTLTDEGCCHHKLNDHDDDDHSDNDTLSSSESSHNSSGGVADNLENSQQADTAKSHTRPAGKVWDFVKHPLLHTVKIFIYIFVVNVIFGAMLFYAEDAITEFVGQIGVWQPFITAAIGLIPNCASSVILAGMYSGGIVNFSAMLAGLVSNSGIALAILFKQRKKLRRNFGIIGILYAAGVVLGVACYFLFPLVGLN